jgi:DNA-binding transcriptional regulator GbsR (MarR family)
MEQENKDTELPRTTVREPDISQFINTMMQQVCSSSEMKKIVDEKVKNRRKVQHEEEEEESSDSDNDSDESDEEQEDEEQEWEALQKLLDSHNDLCKTFRLLLESRFEEK